jgi:hypothetical protein
VVSRSRSTEVGELKPFDHFSREQPIATNKTSKVKKVLTSIVTLHYGVRVRPEDAEAMFRISVCGYSQFRVWDAAASEYHFASERKPMVIQKGSGSLRSQNQGPNTDRLKNQGGLWVSKNRK